MTPSNGISREDIPAIQALEICVQGILDSEELDLPEAITAFDVVWNKSPLRRYACEAEERNGGNSRESEQMQELYAAGYTIETEGPYVGDGRSIREEVLKSAEYISSYLRNILV